MADQQRLAFRDIKLVLVVGDQIVKPRITEGKVQAIGCQLKAEKKAA